MESFFNNTKTMDRGLQKTSIQVGGGSVNPQVSDVKVLLDRSIPGHVTKSRSVSYDCCMDDEDYDDDDDEDDDEDDDDDEEDDVNSSISNEMEEEKKVPNQENLNDKDDGVKKTDEQNSKLKLVLKKSPKINLTNSSVVTARPSKNQILLVTLVSNTGTGSIYSTAKCSIAGPAAAVSTADAKPPIVMPTVPVNSIVKKSETMSEKDLISMNMETGSINSETTLAEDSKNSFKCKKELQQLQKTVTESKILSEYMNDNVATKIRKSRKIIPLKQNSVGENESTDFFTRQRERSRSCSKPRLESPLETEFLAKWPSEEKINKRQNMRSQNNEFVQKHLKFLKGVQSNDGEMSDNSDDESTLTDSKSSVNMENIQLSDTRSILPPPKPGWDSFCWKCHTEGELTPCSKCVRSFHSKCLKSFVCKMSDTWICPECTAIENRMKGIFKPASGQYATDHLNQLLQFAFKRMSQLKGSESFLHKPKEEEHPDFDRYIVNPVTLESLQAKINNKEYKCTEEFAVEVKWMLHNCIVYFGSSSKLFGVAKSIVKVCRQEVNEIETCSECYYNANTRTDWFVEVCSKPHILLWAKLKGFPYWPAKAMGINAAAAVDVRFFGDHDRAYVPIKECFLYSQKDPNPPTKQNKRNNIAECIKEVEVHVQKIHEKFGKFVHAEPRIPYDPGRELEQLELMIPGISEHLRNLEKINKPALTMKIVKIADNHLSIVKKQNVQNETSKNVLLSKETVKCTADNSMLIDSSDKCNPEQPKEEYPYKLEVDSGNISSQHNCSNSEGLVTKELCVNEIPKTNNVNSENDYEVVSKNEEPESSKVSSVILKRKSDNWNTVAGNTPKRVKGNFQDNDVNAEKPLDIGSKKTVEGEHVKNDITIAAEKPNSTEEHVNKAQKQKVGTNDIPPLVLLTQPYVTTAVSIMPTQTVTATNFAPVATKLSHLSLKTHNLPSESCLLKGPVPSLNNLKRCLPNNPTTDGNEPSKKFVISELPNNTLSDPPFQNEKPPLSEQERKTVDTPIDKNSITKKTESKENLKETSVSKCLLLRPFEEIKVEADVEINEKANKVDQTTSVELVGTQQTTPDKSVEEPKNDESVVVKTEIYSDDESCIDDTNVEGAKQIALDENNGDNIANRISVKDMSQLCTMSHDGKEISNIPVAAASSMENKKPLHRARKTFMTKPMFPPGFRFQSPKRTNCGSANNIQTNANFNSMVCIPLESTQTTTSRPSPIPVPNTTTIFQGTFQNLPHCSPNVSACNSPITRNNNNYMVPASSSAPIAQPNPIAQNQPQLSLQPNLCPVSAASPLSRVNQVTDNNSPQHMLAGTVTQNLAAAITDTIVKGPPRLAPRPSGPLRSDGDFVFPSAAGPVCSTLMNNAHKMTDFFRSVIEDTLSDMANNGVLEAKIKILEMEIEKLKYNHAQELAELKNNTDLMLCEMRKSLENEKTRIISETRKQCEIERHRAIEDVKKKQWCANCGKEAQFYCCWNTSYCDYPCQQKHWSRHMTSCAQNDNSEINAQKNSMKASSYNMKEKQQANKPKDSQMVRNNNMFMRGVMPPMPRNPVGTPVQRLMQITNAANPRYTIHCREGSWELMSTPHQKIMAPAGLVMPDQVPKSIGQMPPSLMVESFMRNNHL